MARVGAPARAMQLGLAAVLLVLLGARVGLPFLSGSVGARSVAPPRVGNDAAKLRSAFASPEAPRSLVPSTSSSSLPCMLVALAGFVLAGASASRRRGSTVARKANLVATSPNQAIPWWDRMTRVGIEPGMGIWAEKLNMTTIFDEGKESKTIGATILVIKRGGNIVTAKKWPEKHGYYSVQVGYDRYVPEAWERRGIFTARLKLFENSDLPPLKKLKEFKVRPQDWIKYEIGQKVWPSDLFEEGDLLDIHGRSKGKGFQGAVTKWGHKRGPMSHGSKHHRRYGSVGAGTTPARVFPGKKMPGWTGDKNSVQQGAKILKIIDKIDEDNMPESIIVVKGSVPGYTAHWKEGGSYVYMHKKINKGDGRFKRDPVWLWYIKKGEGVDRYVPIRGQAWTWKTFWGRDIRWVASEVKKYWPDGFPGYDHSEDPFYDGCDPHKAIKAPEW